MRRDHRPYWLRQAFGAYEAWHARHFLFPYLDRAGSGCTVCRPWHVHAFGKGIELGAHVEMRATRDQPIRLTTWETESHSGSIAIGDYALIGPGARLQSASRIELGPSSMLASNVLITDSDWHDLYDRLSAPGRSAPVRIEENAWIGDSAILCKGIRVGRNSIVGAGSVVVDDVPDNTIAAGNPARVVRFLDKDKPVVTRAALFADPGRLDREMDGLYRLALRDNSLLGWLRSQVWPGKKD